MIPPVSPLCDLPPLHCDWHLCPSLLAVPPAVPWFWAVLEFLKVECYCHSSCWQLNNNNKTQSMYEAWEVISGSTLWLLSVHICFIHVILCMCAYVCTWGSVLFSCCWAEPQSNWAGIRLWLILLMSAASRGEDTERKNCQTSTQVTSFIPPASSRLSPCLCSQERFRCPTGSLLITPLSA